MKKGLIIISLFSILLLISGLGGCAKNEVDTTQGNSPSVTILDAQSQNIKLKNFAFNPSEIIIKKGSVVIWTNEDSYNHDVTSESGDELNSGILSKGQTYSHTFNQAGTFDYYCTIHPSMKGKIIVE